MAETLVFVYGTLKRGQANHAHYCRSVRRIEEATTFGALFALPAGYPALRPPAVSVLAVATGHMGVDEARLVEWNRRLRSRADPLPCGPAGGSADLVHGELITLERPRESLRRLDRLEGFVPGRASLFTRALLPIRVGGEPSCRAAWAYVQPAPRGTRITTGRW